MLHGWLLLWCVGVSVGEDNCYHFSPEEHMMARKYVSLLFFYKLP